MTDGEGNVTQFFYDDLDRLVSEVITMAAVTYERSYEYDLAGNLLRTVDRDGTDKN